MPTPDAPTSSAHELPSYFHTWQPFADWVPTYVSPPYTAMELALTLLLGAKPGTLWGKLRNPNPSQTLISQPGSA